MIKCIKLIGGSQISRKPINQVDFVQDRIVVLAGRPDHQLSVFDDSRGFIQYIEKKWKEQRDFVTVTFGVSRNKFVSWKAISAVCEKNIT